MRLFLIAVAASLSLWAADVPVRLYSIGVSAAHPSIPANPELPSLIEELFQTTTSVNVPEESVSFLTGPFARAQFIKKFTARTIAADGVVVLYLNTYALRGKDGILLAASDSVLSNTASFLPLADVLSFTPRALVLILDTPVSNVSPLIPVSDAFVAAACDALLGKIPHSIIRNAAGGNAFIRSMVGNFSIRVGTDTKGIDGTVTAGEFIGALPKAETTANTLGDMSNAVIASYQWGSGSVSLSTNRFPVRRAVLTRNFVVYRRAVNTNADASYTIATNVSQGKWK
ncbi:MAG: hypothetical protein AABZ39_04090 [Spirochaetota bacterium]